MEIKEYPEIIKDGEIIAKKTSIHELVYNFTNQMHERGYTSIVYFSDKKRVKEQEEEQEKIMYLNDDEEITESDDEDSNFPIGLSWGQLFNSTDMINFITHYLNATCSPRGKLLFATRLQNEVMADLMDDSDQEQDFEEEED